MWKQQRREELGEDANASLSDDSDTKKQKGKGRKDPQLDTITQGALHTDPTELTNVVVEPSASSTATVTATAETPADETGDDGKNDDGQTPPSGSTGQTQPRKKKSTRRK